MARATQGLRAAVFTMAFGCAPAFAASTVSIENFTFKPDTLTIHVGEAVTFKNADDIPHSVVIADGSYHSKALDTDDTVTIPFPKPGTYAYFCGLHPHMQGKINVLP